MNYHNNDPAYADATNETQPTIFRDVLDTQPYQKSLKDARTWLYVVAGFQFLLGIFEYIQSDDRTVGTIAFGIDAFLAIIFLILALWSKKKPVAAFTTALIFYVLVNLAFMMLDTSNMYKGIIIKILVVIALVKANTNARKYEAVKTSLGEPM